MTTAVLRAVALASAIGAIATAQPTILKLTEERAFNVQQLRLHAKMLASTSFTERTGMFCTDQADAALANDRASFSNDRTFPAPTSAEAAMEQMRQRAMENNDRQARRQVLESIVEHNSYGITIDEVRKTYAVLSRENPSTREQEVLRQQQIAVLRQAQFEYTSELNSCRKMVLYGDPDTHNGWQAPVPPLPLPTDNELRSEVNKEQNRIAEIDSELRRLRGK